jgi:hypothetical protein
MSNRLMEKSVTIEDPRDGSPFAVTIQLELDLSDCDCTHRTPSLGNPVGYGAH